MPNCLSGSSLPCRFRFQCFGSPRRRLGVRCFVLIRAEIRAPSSRSIQHIVLCSLHARSRKICTEPGCKTPMKKKKQHRNWMLRHQDLLDRVSKFATTIVLLQSCCVGMRCNTEHSCRFLRRFGGTAKCCVQLCVLSTPICKRRCPFGSALPCLFSTPRGEHLQRKKQSSGRDDDCTVAPLGRIDYRTRHSIKSQAPGP